MDTECEKLNVNNNVDDNVNDDGNEKTEEVQENVLHYEANNIGDETKGETTLVRNLSLQNAQKAENNESNRHSDQIYENGKRKVKEEKPPTKVVVRRLPPSMTKETFLEQVSPLPLYDYLYFVNADPSYGIYSFSRAYLNFVNQEDVFTFTRTFDNYVFLDAKGQEYPAVVEFAPFQRVPKQRSKKKDPLTGTIESDPMFITFKENLLAEALENSKPGAKTMKQHYFETEISTAEEINTTPLLEFLKQRRAEKARMRDERREEKKRKEAERKLKQKSKDKKLDGEEEEPVKDVKVLQSIKDRRDGKDRDIKGAKKREDKEKILKENRTREFKNRSGKSYQEERIRQAERREERKKETRNKSFDRKSESHGGDVKESESSEKAEIPAQDDKSRLFIEKKRIYDNKKKVDDDWKGEGDFDKRMKGDRNRGERRQRERDRKRREEFTTRKGFDKKSGDIEKKKVKPYKLICNEYNDTKEHFSVGDKNSKRIEAGESVTEELPEQSMSNVSKEMVKGGNSSDDRFHTNKVKKSYRRKSLESGNIVLTKKDSIESVAKTKRRNSLEPINSFKSVVLEDYFLKESDCPKTNCLEANVNVKNDLSKIRINDITGRRKPVIDNFSKRGEAHKSSSISLRAKDSSKSDCDSNKSSDPNNKNSESNKQDPNSCSRNKDPRTDRRIRNKDRPSLQIYRPGMGKFSKQRLEKEKVLGSSTEVESPSHSPSPTPKVKFQM